jgi:hypothetical protein
MLKAALPSGPGLVAEDLVQWFGEFVELVDAAADLEGHTIDYIP